MSFDMHALPKICIARKCVWWKTKILRQWNFNVNSMIQHNHIVIWNTIKTNRPNKNLIFGTLNPISTIFIHWTKHFIGFIVKSLLSHSVILLRSQIRTPKLHTTMHFDLIIPKRIRVIVIEYYHSRYKNLTLNDWNTKYHLLHWTDL